MVFKAMARAAKVEINAIDRAFKAFLFQISIHYLFNT
jgi:hypothetical protein